MKVLLMLVRLTFVVQLVLGIGLWTGHFLDFVGVHMGIGIVFVVALWALAIGALRSGGPKNAAWSVLLLGLVIAGFGSSQAKIMIGDMHWIVRAVHLLLALGVMPLAERLAKGSGATTR